MPAERARPARSRGGELESFPFKSENQALMRELLVTHAKRQPRERERHHQPVQRGAAHCRPRKRDLRITGGELERLPLLNLKAEPRHAKNRYQCNTSSTTRPREARVAKSGILTAERARLAQKKKKKRRPGRRDSRAGRLPGAHTLRITGRKGVASQVPPVILRGFITL